MADLKYIQKAMVHSSITTRLPDCSTEGVTPSNAGGWWVR
jgi:hypothetical protein